MQTRRRWAADATWVLLIALCLGLASCALVTGEKAYDGPKRPKSETARVVVSPESEDEWGFEDEPWIQSVDGRRYGILTMVVWLLPGRHEFVVANRYITRSNSRPTVGVSSTGLGTTIGARTTTSYVTRFWKVEFDVAAGSKYRIREMPRGRPPKVYFYDDVGNIEEIDASTEVVPIKKK